MFARVTTYELAKGRASESIDAFQPAVDHVRGLDGLVDVLVLVERDGRRAISMTLWSTLDAMERSRVAASSARTDAASGATAEITSTCEFEVGIRVPGAYATDDALLGAGRTA
jgi:heme-degrading monooxygenase HmoA